MRTLQDLLGSDAAEAVDAGDRPPGDPLTLLRELEAREHFHRDGALGGIFHPRSVSLREVSATDSLHVVVRGNRIAAHIDRVSPLDPRPHTPAVYSFPRAAFHNLAGIAEDAVNLLRGRQGDHRCELDCQWTSTPEASRLDPRALLDPADHQWSVQVEVRVSGRLDERRLRGALDLALGRREMSHDPLEVLDVGGPGDGDHPLVERWRSELHSEGVRPAVWPPLRFRLLQADGGDWLMLSISHAATDAVGALSVLAAVASAYRGELDVEHRPDFLSTHELAVRPTRLSVAPGIRRWARRFGELARNLPSNPTGLAADGGTRQKGCGYVHVTLPGPYEVSPVGDGPEATQRVLLSAAHTAVASWNRDHEHPDGRIGVLAPVDLRTSHWPRQAVANLSVTARILTARVQRASVATVWRSVNAQAELNKRTRTGRALIAGLDRAGLVDLWARQSRVVLLPPTSNRSLDAALVASQGSLDDVAGLGAGFGPDGGPITEAWVSVPTRTRRSISIGAIAVSGRLDVTIRYPRRLWSDEAARSFADLYADEIRSILPHTRD